MSEGPLPSSDVIQTQVRSSASVRTILAIFSALFGVGWASLNFAPVLIETLQQGRGLSATVPIQHGIVGIRRRRRYRRRRGATELRVRPIRRDGIVRAILLGRFHRGDEVGAHTSCVVGAVHRDVVVLGLFHGTGANDLLHQLLDGPGTLQLQSAFHARSVQRHG